MSCHILWNCMFTREVWRESGLKLPDKTLQQKDFIDILWKLREVESNLDREVFANIVWSIWRNRNMVKHEGRGRTAKSTAAKEASIYADEYRLGNAPSASPGSPNTSVRPRWHPPDPGWFKLNVDEVVFKESGCCCIGVLIRNGRGETMGAMTKKLPLPLGALEVEAKTAKEGILLARDLGFKEVIIEGDALMVIKAFTKQGLPPCSVQKVIEGSIWRINSFKVLKANHVKRDCNIAAHLPTRHAVAVLDCIVWVEETPPFIFSQVCKDVSETGFSPD